MELLKSVQRRSRLSDVFYIVFNLSFALAVLILTVAFSSPLVAYLLVLLSKWRIFAVRPRFWFVNIQANLVDVLVGLSTVTLIWQSRTVLVAQILIAVLFALWLLVLKPRSKRLSVALQAGIAQFVAIVALFSYAHTFYLSVVVALAWLVGYTVARHVLTHHEEEDGTVLSLAWGLVVAEIAWLSYHSTTAYGAPGVVMVPQVGLVVALLGFAVYGVYHNYKANDGQSSVVGVRRRIWFSVIAIGLLVGRELLTLV